MITHKNRMNSAQYGLLREIRDGKISGEELQRRWAANRKRYSMWFSNRFFWRNLDRIVFIAQRILNVQAFLAVQEAQVKIIDSLKKNEGVDEKFLATYREHRNQTRADLRQMKHRRRRKKEKVKLGEVLHPSFRGREKEFVELMKAHRRKAE